MASNEIVVKLDTKQVHEIINNVLDNMDLVYICPECKHEIYFKKFGHVTCENCGQKWSLSIYGEKIK